MKTKLQPFRSFVLWIAACMIVLMPMPAHADSGDEYIPDVAGGLRIGWVRNNKTTVIVNEPKQIKEPLDWAWMRIRNEWDKHVVPFINEAGAQEQFHVTTKLATKDGTELQVKKLDNGAALKYIVHDNVMYITIVPPWALGKLSYTVRFDVEVTVALNTSNQGRNITFADAALSIPDMNIDGDGILSDLTIPLVELPLEQAIAAIEEISSTLLPSISDIGQQLVPQVDRSADIPADAVHFKLGVAPDSGMISLCFKSQAEGVCEF